jgi:hypothetical protein
LQLRGCYPAIDGNAVHPIAVQLSTVDGQQLVEYSLAKGTLTVRLHVEGNVALLACSLHNFKTAPHWIYPCGNAEVIGVQKFFRQGLGFAGPSGWVDLNQSPYQPSRRTEVGIAPTWFLESYLVSGLMANDDCALAIAALDHRDFLQKSTLRERQQRRGLINRHLAENTLLLECGFYTEGIATGSELKLPDLQFFYDADAWTAFRQTAHAIGKEMHCRTHHEPRYHWCSWYRRGPYFTHGDLQEVLNGFEQISPRVPLQALQIDDGYFTHHGDWLQINERWPQGMHGAFSLIQKHGYSAGIWIAPFMVSNRSRLYQEHPGWVLCDLDGNPIIEARNYEGTANDEERYVLDTSHPDAMEYLRTVFRTLRGWGATLYKTDFMDWGFQDSLNVQRHTPGKTSVQYFRDVLQMIREEIGEESYWLACISPFAPFLGFADGMRLANDSGVSWSAGGTLNMFHEMCSGQYFNNVWWQNDPDSVFLRDYFMHLSETEIESIGLFAGIIGSSVNTSDWLHQLPEHRLKIWRFIQPSQKSQTALLPFWHRHEETIVLVREYSKEQSWGILIINLENKSVTRKLEIRELTGQESLYVFRWSASSSSLLGNQTEIIVELEAHESVLCYVTMCKDAPLDNFTVGGRLV